MSSIKRWVHVHEFAQQYHHRNSSRLELWCMESLGPHQNHGKRRPHHTRNSHVAMTHCQAHGHKLTRQHRHVAAALSGLWRKEFLGIQQNGQRRPHHTRKSPLQWHIVRLTCTSCHTSRRCGPFGLRRMELSHQHRHGDAACGAKNVGPPTKTTGKNVLITRESPPLQWHIARHTHELSHCHERRCGQFGLWRMEFLSLQQNHSKGQPRHTRKSNVAVAHVHELSHQHRHGDAAHSGRWRMELLSLQQNHGKGQPHHTRKSPVACQAHVHELSQ
jgi:hypothetical protein